MRKLVLSIFGLAAIVVGAWLILFSPFLVVGGMFAVSAYQSERRSADYDRARIYERAFADDSVIKVARRSATAADKDWAKVSIDFLQKGGSDSSDVAWRRYLQTNGVRLAENECKALVRLIASRCRIAKVEQDGRSLTIEFQMKDEGGSSLVRYVLGLFSGGEDDLHLKYGAYPKNTAESRKTGEKLYRQISANCGNPILAGRSCRVLTIRQRVVLGDARGTVAENLSSSEVILRVGRNPDLPA